MGARPSFSPLTAASAVKYRGYRSKAVPPSLLSSLLRRITSTKPHLHLATSLSLALSPQSLRTHRGAAPASAGTRARCAAPDGNVPLNPSSPPPSLPPSSRPTGAYLAPRVPLACGRRPRRSRRAGGRCSARRRDYRVVLPRTGVAVFWEEGRVCSWLSWCLGWGLGFLGQVFFVCVCALFV